jgi:hypothetical protein
MEASFHEEISKHMTALVKYPTPKELHDFMQELLKNTGEYENVKWNFDLLVKDVNKMENSIHSAGKLGNYFQTFETKYNNDTRSSNSKIYIHTQQIDSHATDLGKHSPQINQILSQLESKKQIQNLLSYIQI